MFKPILEERQPIVYKVLYNSLKHKQASHAYLFTGPKGSKKLDTARLFAQSLVCPNHSPFACEECEICKRIEHNTFSDLILLDGSLGSIKKDDVLKLQEAFSKTALETYGKKIYIVNEAEKATEEALNSLLKFLEEPSGQDTYAILISEKPEALLETIISRCQTLSFKAQSQQALLKEIDPNSMDMYEAHLLSEMVNDSEDMNALALDENFKHSLNMFGVFIDEYIKAPYLGEIFIQNHLLKKKEASVDRIRLHLFFQIGMLFFKDILFKTAFSSKVWKSRMNQIVHQIDPLKAFTLFNDNEAKISQNANLSLLIDALLFQLKEGEK